VPNGRDSRPPSAGQCAKPAADVRPCPDPLPPRAGTDDRVELSRHRDVGDRRCIPDKAAATGKDHVETVEMRLEQPVHVGCGKAPESLRMKLCATVAASLPAGPNRKDIVIIT